MAKTANNMSARVFGWWCGDMCINHASRLPPHSCPSFIQLTNDKWDIFHKLCCDNPNASFFEQPNDEVRIIQLWSSPPSPLEQSDLQHHAWKRKVFFLAASMLVALARMLLFTIRTIVASIDVERPNIQLTDDTNVVPPSSNWSSPSPWSNAFSFESAKHAPIAGWTSCAETVKGQQGYVDVCTFAFSAGARSSTKFCASKSTSITII